MSNRKKTLELQIRMEEYNSYLQKVQLVQKFTYFLLNSALVAVALSPN